MTTRYAPSVSATPKRLGSRLHSRRQFQGFLFVLPSVVFTLIFFIFPMITSVWISLNDWPLSGTPTFTGLGNYIDLLDDRRFTSSLWFTIQYTPLVIPPTLILGMLLALLVNQPLKGIGLFRTIYFMPLGVGLAASSFIWIWLFHNDLGIIYSMYRDLGLLEGNLIWFKKKDMAVTAVIISVVWKTAGFSMILFLAGMQAIPGELYEAAKVDGANAWSRNIRISLPLLRRTIALALILTMIGSFLAFEQFFIMTSGGPRQKTVTVVYKIFVEAFRSFEMGVAAALSMVLLVILLFFSYLQLPLLRDETGVSH